MSSLDLKGSSGALTVESGHLELRLSVRLMFRLLFGGGFDRMRIDVQKISKDILFTLGREKERFANQGTEGTSKGTSKIAKHCR